MPHIKTNLTFASLMNTAIFAAFAGLLVQPSHAAEKKDTTADWKTVFTDSGTKGGFRVFTLKHDTTVNFVWDVIASSQRAVNFRVTVAKQLPRTGAFHKMGVIALAHKSSTGSKKVKLKAGKYQLYIAIKRAEYEVKVKAEKS